MMKIFVVFMMILKLCKYCKIEFSPPKKNPSATRCSSKKCLQKYKNEWARNNPKSKQDWLERNKEKRKIISEQYRKRNSNYYAEYSSLRSRKLKQAKPSWLSEWDLFLIEELYITARERGLEVDHIIPLKHKLVCGLHVPWNMQLLTRTANAKKSNKFDEDIVGVYADE